MKILLLSAYDAASHQYWHRGLREHLPEHQWTLLTLPPRHFKWRMRGNPLSWAFTQRAVLERDYDCVLATSMVDLATLRGLVPALASKPNLLYFHENQFSYPSSKSQHGNLEVQLVSVYSALCADALVFNSIYNRDTFLAGVAKLCKRLPDGIPPGICEDLALKSQVLPVPLYPTDKPPPRNSNDGALQVVWNHRWEYDKGPDLLAEAITNLPAALDLQFHIVGQQFRQEPEAFGRIYRLLNERGWLGEWGFMASVEDYRALLKRAHIVVSTALHDFQGLAVLEAVAAGCLPLVPDRLAYPQWFPPWCRYGKDPEEAQALAEQLHHWHQLWRTSQLPLAPSVRAWSWPELLDPYRKLLTSSKLVS